jgi:hypothetical protein
MPETTQYDFSHREVLLLLLKQAGVREGRWMFSATFRFGAGNFGQSETHVFPGAVITLEKLGIVRAPEDAPPSLVVDAAEMKPQKKKTRVIKKKTT